MMSIRQWPPFRLSLQKREPTMILELVEYVLTPCSLAMRRLGYLRGQLGIKVRHRQCRRAWREHLKRTQSAIRAGLLECSQRRKAVVMGSGLLLDVPLADLSAMFREVILVDVVHPLRAYVATWRYRNVRLLRADVTETAAELARVAKIPQAPLPQAAPQLFCDDPEIDYVVSVNLLSQLPYIPSLYLAKSPHRAEQEIDDYAVSLIHAHLDYLTRLPGVVTLITDIEKIQVDAEGREIDRFDILYGVKLPWTGEEWTWEHVPVGHLSREHAYLRRVCAVTNVKSECGTPNARRDVK
jgi:hypothetical protein